jgi:hypothetical protein
MTWPWRRMAMVSAIAGRATVTTRGHLTVSSLASHGLLHGPDASSLSARRHDNSNQALHATPAPNPNCVRNRNRPLVTVDLLPRPEHQLPTPTPAPPSLSIAPPPPLRLCTSAPLRLCTPASSTTLSLCSFPNPHHALPDHPPTHTPTTAGSCQSLHGTTASHTAPANTPSCLPCLVPSDASRRM